MRLTNRCFFAFITIIFMAWSSLSFAADNAHDYKDHITEAGKNRFEFDNDTFVNSDNGFSNSWSFQLHSPVSDSWNNISDFPSYLKSFAEIIPGLTDDGLKYRMSFSLSQLIQTPHDIEDPDPIPNDVPYVGMLTGQFGFIAFNDNEFRGGNITLGVSGRPSLAEQSQNIVHKTGIAEVVQGWDHQIETAPLINLTYMYKKKFYRSGNPAGFSFDTSFSGDVELGNIVTAAGVRLEMRFGENMPAGFAPYPDPIGRFMAYDARLAPANTKASSIYGSVGLHATAVAHIILIDGNLIRDDPAIAGRDVEKETGVGFLFIGFHYERPTWGLHIQHATTTDFAKASTATATEEPENTFVSLMFEWLI